MRLSPARTAGGVAGKDLQASALPEKQGRGRRDAASELDDLCVASGTVSGLGGEPEVSSGLRADAPDFQSGLAAHGEVEANGGLAQ